MRIVILTQYYPPEIGAPQGRLSELASRLLAAGHEVTVLTAMPSYPQGKIYSGYTGLVSREEKDGVEILRTFIYPTRSAAFIPRLFNYFSFLFSSSFLGTFLLRRADYLLVESPPLFLGLGAIWLSWLKGAKLIFNVSDLWPDSAVYFGVISRDSAAYGLSSRLESFCYRHAWLVTGQTNGILSNIRARFPNVRTFLLRNGSDTKLFTPEKRTSDARRRLINDDKFIALYAGLHGLAQGLDQVLEAANKLPFEQYRFILIGDGPEKEKLMEKAKNLSADIVFVDPMPKDQIPDLLAAADVLLVPLARDIAEAVPSKFYEAMASGRPLVVVSSCEAAEIVKQHEAGIVVGQGDVSALADAIRTLRMDPDEASRMGENARRVAVENYDRAQIAGSFITYLEEHHSTGFNTKYETGYETDWSAGK
jgi:colanic acid biosynthesis glycosyl transferase WcaI